MKYKVGDKVRVREDLEVDEQYGSEIFTNSMKKFMGKIYEIGEEKCEAYWLKEIMQKEYQNFYFSPEMLRPAKFKIWCETEAEKQAVSEELEKEGYVWKNGREKPTDSTYIGFFDKKPCGLYIQNDELGWDNSKQNFHIDNTVEITPYEFTGIDFSEKIIITKTMTGATATYGDKTVAVEGDFEDASRQALVEVLCPFKVGDKVHSTETGFVGKIEKIDTDMTVLVTNDKNIERWIKFKDLEPYTEPLYNAKLFCTVGGGPFNKGHIYEIKNGMFAVGYLTQCKPYKDLEDINKNLVSQFMEVKGGLDE